MRYRDESCRVLETAEAELRSIAANALADRSYADVARLASLADALRDLSQRAHKDAGVPQSARPSGVPAPSRPVNRPSTPRSKTRTRSPRGYPRFERDGDKLVKTGWSKKAREEYEHRAPRKAVEAFAEYLSSSVQAGQRFFIENVLPIRQSSGEEVPSYQVYLALAWLREHGAVKKMGREGYILEGDVIRNGGLAELWARTEARQS